MTESCRRVAGAVAVALALAKPAGALDPAKPIAQYGLDGWRVEDGLPHNTVNAIAQTPDGYLWIATWVGLARFDGVRFKVHDRHNTPELGHSGIRALAVAPDGALWIGTNGGGLVRMADRRFTRWSTEQGLTTTLISQLLVDGDRLWIGTNGDGVVRFESGAFRPVVGTEGLSVRSLLRDTRGVLWVGTLSQGLLGIGPDGSVRRPAARVLQSGTVLALHEDPRGRLWVGTSASGLLRLDDGRVERPFPDADGALSIIFGFSADDTGTVWIGGTGLAARARGEALEVIGPGQGLPHGNVGALLPDREGSLWLGTNGSGLWRLRDSRFTTATVRQGLSDNHVYGMTEDHAGTVWAATRNGLSEWNGTAWRQHVTTNGFCHDHVRSVAVDAAGTVWAATYGGGVCERTPAGWRAHGPREGLVHPAVRAVLHARDGAVWVGTAGGVGRRNNGAWHSLTRADGLSHDSVLCLLESRDGTVWIGTESGLTTVRGDSVAALREADGLVSDTVLSLLEDGQGRVWAGTPSGLTRVGPGPSVSYTVRDGLPGDAVHQMIDDARGHLWICGTRGVARIPWSSLDRRAAGEDERLEVTLFDEADGMKSRQCSAPVQPSGLRTRDGRLWFGTEMGVAALDPAALPLGGPPPPAVVEEIVADGVQHEAHEVVLPPGTRRLEIAYTGLSLIAPQRTRFRARLVGFDPVAIDVGEQRRLAYTAVPPGRYSFEVTACIDARCGEPASVAIVLQPRLHETMWFRALAALAVVLALAGGHVARTRRLKARERELTRLVAQRTESLRAAMVEAEAQRHAAEEANATKTELLAIAAHDLKNPLQVVMGSAEMIRSGLAPDVHDELLGTIQRSSGRMVRLIDDLLTTAALDVGRLELRREPIDMGELLQDVVRENQSRAEAKQQQIELVAGEDCAVLGDRERLREALDNIVGNAVKYAPPGTTIHVDVIRVEAGVRASVRDEGPGLTEEDLARAFGKFQRLSSKPSGGESSTGLGLSIVRRLAELHGGQAWAESEGRGRGATFFLELPALHPPEAG